MIPQRECRYDAVVLGAGPAGFAAAYTAAKHGARVLLVEQSGDVGGIATSGMMSHWTGRCDSSLYREILERSAARNEGEWQGKVTRYIDPEKLKTLLLEMLLEVGVELWLYSFAADAICEDERIRGVLIYNKSGHHLVYADTVIDATGDGDIAARAGASYLLGREQDGKMQPATVMFKLGGVSDGAVYLGSFEETYETERGELQALAKKHLPAPAGHVLLYRSTHAGVVTCNMTNCTDIDGTRTEDLTRATLVCRQQMEEIVHFLREFVPGYERCYLLSSASLVGIRETRHFVGEYTLTEEDILEARVFDDYVVRGAHFNFDVHNLSGAGLDPTGVQKKFKQSEGYTIPYRSLLPISTEGLLLCGRNISGTHLAHSNFRVMPICVGIGAAAGAAAALASRNGILPRRVRAEEIRALIFEDCR